MRELESGSLTIGDVNGKLTGRVLGNGDVKSCCHSGDRLQIIFVVAIVGGGSVGDMGTRVGNVLLDGVNSVLVVDATGKGDA